MEKDKNVKVLAAIDGSPLSETVLKHCARYAQLSTYELDLALIHVLEDDISYKSFPRTPLYQEREKEGYKILDQAKHQLDELDVKCNTILVVGPVAESIVRIAEENHVDYIVMGNRGYRGLKRMLLGSVADEVSKHAHCAVTIVRQNFP